jgi:hypothetical protein
LAPWMQLYIISYSDPVPSWPITGLNIPRSDSQPVAMSLQMF